MSVINVKNGLPVFDFHDSVESKIIETRHDYKNISTIANQKRD